MSTLRITPNLLLFLSRRKTLTRLLYDDISRRDYTEYDKKINVTQPKYSIYKSKMRSLNSGTNNTNKILTIPNILTLSRLATAPAMGYFIWNGMHTPAIVCFAYAAVTDLLDGWIARKFKQESEVGAIIDPIADKVLLTTCFIAFYNVGTIPLWLVQMIVARDLILLGGGAVIRKYSLPENKQSIRHFIDFKNYPSLGFEPTLTSKCNTALQCLLIATHLSTTHLVDHIYYDWTMFGFHGLVFSTTLITLCQYGVRAQQQNFFARQPKSKC